MSVGRTGCRQGKSRRPRGTPSPPISVYCRLSCTAVMTCCIVVAFYPFLLCYISRKPRASFRLPRKIMCWCNCRLGRAAYRDFPLLRSTPIRGYRRRIRCLSAQKRKRTKNYFSSHEPVPSSSTWKLVSSSHLSCARIKSKFKISR